MDILKSAVDGIQHHMYLLDEEQAIKGIDFYSELELHALLEQSFQNSEYNAFREVPYPLSAQDSIRSARRCDFVLTPNGTTLTKAMHCEDESLFAPVLTPCLPEDAYWLEVKAIRFDAGIRPAQSGLSVGRGSSRKAINSDVIKLSSDTCVAHAGLLLFIFARDHQQAEYDLHRWYLEQLKNGAPISHPESFKLDLIDRNDRSACLMTLIPVHHY